MLLMSEADPIAVCSLLISVAALAVALGRDRARPVFSLSQDASSQTGVGAVELRVSNAGYGAMTDLRFESAATVTPRRVPRLESGGTVTVLVSWGEWAEDEWQWPDEGEDGPSPLPGLPRLTLRYRTAPFGRSHRMRVRPAHAERHVADPWTISPV